MQNNQNPQQQFSTYMKSIYPSKLIAQCQKVIGEKAKRKVSRDEAELYLDQFARLGKLIINSKLCEKNYMKETKTKK